MGLSAAYLLDANGSKVFTPVSTNYVINLEVAGVLSAHATNDVKDFDVRAPGDFQLLEVLIAVGTAPTGADLIVQIEAAGSAIFATANRPTIAAAATSGSSSNMLETQAARVFTSATEFNVVIPQVGSGVAGADLSVQLIGLAL